MPERSTPKSGRSGEKKVDQLIEDLKGKSADELQRFDIRLTRRGGKFAVLAALLRGDFGDPDELGEEEVIRRVDAAMANIDDST